jgi:hypothetical protein
MVDVGVQVSDWGSYSPPEFRDAAEVPARAPPQTTIRLPVQTAVWRKRASGAFTVVMRVQVSETGS